MKKLLFAVGQVLVPAFLIALPAAAPVSVAGDGVKHTHALARAGLPPRGQGARAEEPRSRPLASPRSTAASTALGTVAPPAELSDIVTRMRAARAAAIAPGQPVPHPAVGATAIAAAPLSARIGRDVTVRRRPGVGTPMQIRGGQLQLRRQAAKPDEDDDVATAREFLRSNRKILLLDDPDNELSTQKPIADDLGYRHLKFQQQFRGLSVWPNQLIVHLDRESNVYLMDGSFVPTPRLTRLKPVVDSQAALRIARREAGAGEGAKATAPELFIYASGTRPARLAWKVAVSPTIAASWLVVVDAINGARLARINQVESEGLDGSGVDTNGLTRSIHVFRATDGQIYMIDASKFMYDATSQPPDYNQTRGAIFIYDSANTPDNDDPSISDATWGFVTSTDPNDWAPADAVSASFGLGFVYDYYKDTHNRNAIDGVGGTIYGLVRLGSNYHNAFWNSSEKTMCFGDADNYSGSLDVVGHELTHGVTDNTAGLIYQDQSGAMNEAISDIFGEMVEFYTYGSNDWIIGSEMNNPLRDMSDPASKGQPGTMSEFVNTTDDNGGVHTNSGIVNHAFYYLAEGLNGSIGKSDSERIFYRALSMHLTQSSQFLDLRLAAIQSADEIFGAGSVQSQRTADAFDNVEILDAEPAPPPDDSPVSAANSTFFVAQDTAGLRLARREAAQGDPSQGDFVATNTVVAEERPSVSGDGTLAFFVSADNDGCFVPTDDSAAPSCVGLPGEIASVAMSRDAALYGFVLLDAAGDRDNRITVVDLNADTAVTYELASAPTEGGAPSVALFADSMDFTANKRFLLYDALHVVQFGDGSSVGLWSISALDFSSALTYAIVPPFSGFDIGFPSVAHTSDDFYTFEVDNQEDGTADVYAANLQTGDLTAVITGVPSGPLVPSYTGDDRGIVYTYPDSTAPTARSLAIEALAADHVTAVGDPAAWIFDGEFGVIYRRGSYTGPVPGCVATDTTLCLSGGRFQVSVTFTTPVGKVGSGQAVPLTADTGYFTFFDPNNVEVVVKVLNACGFSQRFWVFAGGLTNAATVVSVTDTLTGVNTTYANPQSTPFQPVQDTSAFTTCFGPSLSSPEELAGLAAVAEAAAAWKSGELSESEETATVLEEFSTEAVASCSANNQTLCLNAGRYKVQTTWHTQDGRSGSGNAVLLTPDTGYFWFFDQNNVEMVVKVLDACSFSGHHWTFAGGLTNIQVTTTVTDTQTGVIKTYTNALGKPFQPIQDTSAFLCP